ncbi:hypothetical protein K2Y11_04905 [bacterium]|nr:hypothetical protein [bacterium]
MNKAKRLRWAVFFYNVTIALIVLITSYYIETINLPFTQLRFDSLWILLCSTLMAALAIILHFTPGNLYTSLATGATTTLLIFALGYHQPKRGDLLATNPNIASLRLNEESKVWISDKEWWDNYIVKDDVLGYRGRPNFKAQHFHPDFSGAVTYTFDSTGWRKQPIPEKLIDSRPIIFLGCSFTFGYGVEDDETFLALLANRSWKDYRVVNCSMGGYGTANLDVALAEVLEQNLKPLCVFYGFITDHFRRNYLRKSRRAGLNQLFPYFDMEGNILRYKGLSRPETATMDDNEELDKKEIQITYALIADMASKCQQHEVPFIFVYFDYPPIDFVESIRSIPGVNVINAAEYHRDRNLSEGHPNKEWHIEIAHLLASDSNIKDWTHSKQLYHPDEFPLPKPHWVLVKSPHSEGMATLKRELDPNDSAKVGSIIEAGKPSDPTSESRAWALSRKAISLAVQGSSRRSESRSYTSLPVNATLEDHQL